MAAIQPLLGTTPTQGQRFQLFIYPQADQAYTLDFQYYLCPDALTTASPFAYGGMAHAETILESCLSIAEQRMDDARLIHTQKFMERLIASIGLDRRNKPQTLGYNGDRSDGRFWNRRDRHWEAVVAVNGVTY